MCCPSGLNVPQPPFVAKGLVRIAKHLQLAMPIVNSARDECVGIVGGHHTKYSNATIKYCFFPDFWIFLGLEPLLSEKGDCDSGDGGRLNATLTDKDVKGTI